MPPLGVPPSLHRHEIAALQKQRNLTQGLPATPDVHEARLESCSARSICTEFLDL